MLKKIIYLPVLSFLISCQSSTSDPDSNSREPQNISKGDTTGFFENCQEIISHSSLGSLQGIDANKDSIENLYWAECFECEQTFEIILAYKNPKDRTDEEFVAVSKKFETGCDNYFKDFRCFAFVYPMRDPDKQYDEHAMNIDFPVTINIYERLSGDKWEFIQKVKARNFKEFSRIQFKTIYHLK